MFKYQLENDVLAAAHAFTHAPPFKRRKRARDLDVAVVALAWELKGVRMGDRGR
jgi:hypothetical protein